MYYSKVRGLVPHKLRLSLLNWDYSNTKLISYCNNTFVLGCLILTGLYYVLVLLNNACYRFEIQYVASVRYQIQIDFKCLPYFEITGQGFIPLRKMHFDHLENLQLHTKLKYWPCLPSKYRTSFEHCLINIYGLSNQL